MKDLHHDLFLPPSLRSTYLGADEGDASPEPADDPPDSFAEGTGIRRSRREYLVRVQYREPTYELRVGKKKFPYRWSIQLFATCAEEAMEIARREIGGSTRISNVGWIRVIVSMVATEVL